MDSLQGLLEQKSKENKQIFDQQLSEVTSRIMDLKAELSQEAQIRKAEDTVLGEKIAEEHLNRETDESAIIGMLESLMKQVKSMNTFVENQYH